MAIKSISFEPGFMVLTDEVGERARQPIADILRALDIPALVISRVPPVTALANILIIVVKALLEANVIGEELSDEYDLEFLLAALKTLNAEWDLANMQFQEPT